MTCRVLHFHFGKEGGAERFFVNLAGAFQRRGVEQRFFIRPNRSWESDIARLGPVTLNNFSRLSPLSLLAHVQASHTVRTWKPDAVMAWMPRACRLVGNWDGPVKLARLGDYPKNLKHFGNCDVLIGNVPGIAKRCYDLGWQRPALTISNFPRDVGKKQIDRANLGASPSDIIVSASGRFVHRKGFDVLIRAIAQVPNLHLWLMGEGREQSSLVELAASLGIQERVKFLGWVDEPMHYVRASDIFVMPSRHEPLGNVLLEAWQSDVATISSRSEGPSWYMRDQVEGLMFDIDDVAGLVTALRKLADDRELRTKYATNAQHRLEELFSEDAIVNAYLDVFAGKFDHV